MSEKEFPSCAYDVCAEFDCEETMALALIATRNELDRARKALDLAKDTLCWYDDNYDSVVARNTLDEIKTALEQKDK